MKKMSNNKTAKFMKRVITYDGYLDEKKLGQCLVEIFPDYKFIHDNAVPGSGISNRPDYRCEELKLIVEFDGYKHYCEIDTIFKDRLKDEAYTSMGYRIVRIPYFVQLTSDVVKHYFGVDDVDMQINFPHGFIADKGAKLPAEYCSLGIVRFMNELRELIFLRTDIINSLKAKLDKYNGEKSRVFPVDVCEYNIELENLLQN